MARHFLFLVSKNLIGLLGQEGLNEDSKVIMSTAHYNDRIIVNFFNRLVLKKIEAIGNK